ncbi:MAG: DNA polymerase domain-containing protein, partial [Erysipelotrichaceae bacterium]|nr:DNA polymerase domain-containing protein [Erysipelotrichaceae bacterium]
MVGFAKSVVSIDASSLYPSCILTLNISNETKVGWVEPVGENVLVKTVSGKSKTMTREEFKDFVRKANLAIAPNRVLFSQRTIGVLPSLLKRMFDRRKKIKTEMLNIEKLLSKADAGEVNLGDKKDALIVRAEQLDVLQKTIKVEMNSVYGGCGEKHYALFDVDLSTAITSAGRETIKQTAKLVNQRASELFGADIDVGIYTDTDSRYFTIDPILEKRGVKFLDDSGSISREVYEISEDIANYVDAEIAKWHKRTWNCVNPAIGFKREALAPAGIFVTKKRYCLWDRDDEGVLCDKFVYHGLEVVRSSTPAAVKPMIKGIIEAAIKSQDRSEIVKLAKKYWNEYQKLSTVEKSVAIGCNKIQEYL